MATTLPTLNALWRTSPVDDREKVRQYAGAPATGVVLSSLTNAMNLMAEASPAAVTACQAWIDEIEELEELWASKVAEGSAHLGNAEEYEGLPPGTTLTRDELMEQADVVRWNVGLLKVRYRGGGAGGTEGAVLASRIDGLKQKVLTAVGFDGVSSGARIVRS